MKGKREGRWKGEGERERGDYGEWKGGGEMEWEGRERGDW